MANNHEPEKFVDTESEYSEEDEENDDRSSEDVDSQPENDLEQTQFSKIPILSELPKTPQPPPSFSEDDYSESDTEPNSSLKSMNLMDVSQKSIAAEARSKPSDSQEVTLAKRPAEEKLVDAKDGKRSKLELEKKTDVSDSGSKKVLFQRLWSEADEIVILVGMLNYAEMKKSNSVGNIDSFLDFIKEHLHIEVSKNQLRDKITKLRKKYENNKIKNRTTFVKPHEQKVFELSMEIWGNDKGKEIVLAIPLVNGSVKKSTNPKVNGSAVRNFPQKKVNAAKSANSVDIADGAVEKMELGKRVSSSGVNVAERVLRIGAEMFEGANEVKGTKEWKKLLVDEMELHVKELDIQRARAKLVLDSLKSVNP